MIPTEAFDGIRRVLVLLERDRDTALRYVRKCEAENSDPAERAFWQGKFAGLAVSIGILKERVEAWETDNERELEEMAEERSEKDCLWEARE